jgi:hypothetical protein
MGDHRKGSPLAGGGDLPVMNRLEKQSAEAAVRKGEKERALARAAGARSVEATVPIDVHVAARTGSNGGAAGAELIIPTPAIVETRTAMLARKAIATERFGGAVSDTDVEQSYG